MQVRAVDGGCLVVGGIACDALVRGCAGGERALDCDGGVRRGVGALRAGEEGGGRRGGLRGGFGGVLW